MKYAKEDLRYGSSETVILKADSVVIKKQADLADFGVKVIEA